MAMDSTLKLDPSCVFFNDSVLSYTSMGPPTLSTDLGSPAHLFVERPSTAPAQISPGCGEVHEDPHKRRFPGPGYYELPSPDCVSQFPHRPASPHYSLASPRSRRAPPVGRRPRARCPRGASRTRPAPPRSRAPDGLSLRPPVDGPRARRGRRRGARTCSRPTTRAGSSAARLLWPRHVDGCVEINLCVGCTRQFFTGHFSAIWLERRPASPRHRARVDGTVRAAPRVWIQKKRHVHPLQSGDSCVPLDAVSRRGDDDDEPDTGSAAPERRSDGRPRSPSRTPERRPRARARRAGQRRLAPLYGGDRPRRQAAARLRRGGRRRTMSVCGASTKSPRL